MMANTSSLATTRLGAQRRAFMLIQTAKALVGGAVGLCFFGMVGRPDVLELVAMTGLLMPGALALLGFTEIRLPVLEQIGLASFALLIGYLAILTGGVTSPLVVWFALVPAEAALVGGRPAVMRAGIAAAGALVRWLLSRRLVFCRHRGLPCRSGRFMSARCWRRWFRRC